MNYKNKREIYQALTSDKKITDGYVVLHFTDRGNLVDAKGVIVEFQFHTPEKWKEYEEKKKYVFYRHFYTFTNSANTECRACTDWVSEDWKDLNGVNRVLLKTDVREIEGMINMEKVKGGEPINHPIHINYIERYAIVWNECAALECFRHYPPDTLKVFAVDEDKMIVNRIFSVEQAKDFYENESIDRQEIKKLKE